MKVTVIGECDRVEIDDSRSWNGKGRLYISRIGDHEVTLSQPLNVGEKYSLTIETAPPKVEA